MPRTPRPWVQVLAVPSLAKEIITICCWYLGIIVPWCGVLRASVATLRLTGRGDSANSQRQVSITFQFIKAESQACESSCFSRSCCSHPQALLMAHGSHSHPGWILERSRQAVSAARGTLALLSCASIRPSGHWSSSD